MSFGLTYQCVIICYSSPRRLTSSPIQFASLSQNCFSSDESIGHLSVRTRSWNDSGLLCHTCYPHCLLTSLRPLEPSLLSTLRHSVCFRPPHPSPVLFEFLKGSHHHQDKSCCLSMAYRAPRTHPSYSCLPPWVNPTVLYTHSFQMSMCPGVWALA